jgi:hypothetical protein
MPKLDNVYLNATMLSDPIFEKDYITIPIDGTISMKDPTGNKGSGFLVYSAQQQKMPVFIGN